jgi:hypothetical protein
MFESEESMHEFKTNPPVIAKARDRDARAISREE